VGEIPPFFLYKGKIKMKLYLASYFEIENHGPGRKIGIAPGKPKNLMDDYGYDCEVHHEWLSPEGLYWDYHAEKKSAQGNDEMLKMAGEKFVDAYNERLNSFKATLEEESEKTGQTIQELIGFEEGDTLLSWEKAGNTSYRSKVGEFLTGLGYEVEAN
jgi:hypothetical protein